MTHHTPGQIEELVAHFQVMVPTQREYYRKLGQLWIRLTEHFEGEEPDLHKLRSSISPQAGEAIGTTYTNIQPVMPTRSHPMAPNSPVSK
jgi:hypothetical protein